VVSKYWYAQCYRAYFILLNEQKANVIKFISKVPNYSSLHCLSINYCDVHDRIEIQKLTICDICLRRTCFFVFSRGISHCGLCIQTKECTFCRKLEFEGATCSCGVYCCKNCCKEKKHVKKRCQGISCEGSEICPVALHCDKCFELSYKKCCVCEDDVSFCVRLCYGCHRREGLKTYFCAKHKKGNCPVCVSHGCPKCFSSKCFLCDTQKCNSINLKGCSMTKIKDVWICTECVEINMQNEIEEKATSSKRERCNNNE
jgi:hypothetical protein